MIAKRFTSFKKPKETNIQAYALKSDDGKTRSRYPKAYAVKSDDGGRTQHSNPRMKLLLEEHPQKSKKLLKANKIGK